MKVEVEDQLELMAPLLQWYVTEADSPFSSSSRQPSQSELDQLTSNASSWSYQQYLIVEEAVNSLIPYLRREYLNEIEIGARELTVKACGKALYDRLDVRPYRPADDKDP